MKRLPSTSSTQTPSAVHGAVGGQKVHETVALDVFDPNAFGFLDDNVQGVIVIGPVLVLDPDELFRLHDNLLHGIITGMMVLREGLPASDSPDQDNSARRQVQPETPF